MSAEPFIARLRHWHRTAQRIGRADSTLWFQYAVVLIRHTVEVAKQSRARHHSAYADPNDTLWQRYAHATYWAAQRAEENEDQRRRNALKAYLAEQNWTKARGLAEDLLLSDSDGEKTTEAFYAVLKHFTFQNDWSSVCETATVLLQVLPSNPKAATALRNSIRFFVETNRYSEAHAAAKLLDDSLGNAETHHIILQSLIKTKRWHEAHQTAEILDEIVGNTIGQSLLLNACEENQQWTRARSIAKSILKSNPDDIDAHRSIIRSYIKQKRWHDAHQAALELFKIQSYTYEDISILKHILKYYVQTERWVGAKNIASEVIRFVPNDTDALLALEKIEDLHRIKREQAERLAEEARTKQREEEAMAAKLAEERRLAEVEVIRALMREELQNAAVEPARNAATAILHVFPNDAEALAVLRHIKQKEEEEKKRAQERHKLAETPAVRLQVAEALRSTLRAHLRTNAWNNAQTTAQKILRLVPDDSEAQRVLHEIEGRFQEQKETRRTHNLKVTPSSFTSLLEQEGIRQQEEKAQAEEDAKPRDEVSREALNVPDATPIVNPDYNEDDLGFG